MKVRIFAIRDKKAEAFNQPLFFTTDGAAQRAFIDACGNQDQMFVKHPEDYYLAVIGIFDDATGVIEAFPSPLPILSAEQAVGITRAGI